MLENCFILRYVNRFGIFLHEEAYLPRNMEKCGKKEEFEGIYTKYA